MTAHFIGNLLGNGVDVIFTAIQLIKWYKKPKRRQAGDHLAWRLNLYL
jgi:hypothetical protein